MENIIHCEKRRDEDMTMDTIQELEHLKSVEWITTGQMIDQLKMNHVAESNYENCKTFVIKKEHGYFMHVNEQKLEDGLGLPFQITVPAIIKAKWRILPKFVTLEEAKKAFEEGKIIGWHLEGDRTLNFCRDNDELTDPMTIKIKRLFEGKWTIEN
jgi:hypothetical protein